MPIYEYRCESCGHELERLQKIADEPLRECPECSAASLRKVISPVGFRLKGSGWYETDFKKGNQRNLVDSDAGSKSSDSKSSDSKKSDTGTSDSSSGTKSTSSASAKGSTKSTSAD